MPLFSMAGQYNRREKFGQRSIDEALRSIASDFLRSALRRRSSSISSFRSDDKAAISHRRALFSSINARSANSSARARIFNCRSEKSLDIAFFFSTGQPAGNHPQCENRQQQPTRIEKILTASMANDAAEMQKLADAGITPVIVPDDDKDHQGSVYAKEEMQPELV